MDIPKQLNQSKFLLLRDTSDPQKGKIPLEKGWNKDKNYLYEEMISKDIPKYGVICGYNNLIVIDCDTEEFEKACLNNPLFDTFTVKTAGKGLSHFYFKIKDKDYPTGRRFNRIIHKENGEEITTRICDMQGMNTYVLGPNSSIGNKKYHVSNDSPIKEVEFEILHKWCKTCIPDIEEVTIRADKKAKEPLKVFDMETDPVISYIKSKITVRDLLESWNIDTHGGRNCECPFHESENGQCFSYEDHQWHCFHCGKGGSMFNLIMEKYKCNFIDAKDRLADMVNIPNSVLKDAKRLAVLTKKDKATEYLANKFIAENPIYSIENDNKTEMWVYMNGIYKPKGQVMIKKFVRALTGLHYKVNLMKQVADKVEISSFIDSEKFFDVYYPGLIAVKNGILNTTKNVLEPFDKEKIFFNRIPVEYDPNIKLGPQTESFFKSTFKDTKDIDLIQELFGYLLYNENIFDKAFMFSGKGSNGKSVLIELIHAFLGVENVSAVPIQDIDNQNFAAYSLFGKLANIYPDISTAPLEMTGKLKSLISGEPITVDRKNQAPIKLIFRGKMIYAANTIPETKDITDGFFRRWDIIDFPFTFKNEKEFNLLSKEDKESGSYKIADTKLIDKLTSKKELSGLLTWSLEGLQRLLKNKEFSKTAMTDELRKIWLRRASPARAFMDDKLIFTDSEQDIIWTENMRDYYIRYCEKYGLPVESIQIMNKIFNTKINSVRTRRNGVNGEIRKVWKRVKIKGDINGQN